MTDASLADREADAVLVLSRRLRALRRFVLFPLALVSAATAVPAYVLFRDFQMEAQWRGGAEVAVHLPLLTGLAASLPAVVCFALSVLVYRAIRRRRLRTWKRELCREHELPEGQLDDLGRLSH